MKKSILNPIKTIPIILLVIVCVVLFIDIFAFYRKLQYGKCENPENIPLETYLAGDNQPTHPSVYDFGKKWNGYRYWMSYSPYPYANGEEENPCIAVSNDMQSWTVPSGLFNPVAFNEETACDELKDPHIVYNNTTDSIEIWYLGRVNGTIASGSDLLMMRKKSDNGIEWSSYQVLDTVNGTLSPSIIFEDGKYKRWSIRPSADDRPGQLLYSESQDAFNWTTHSACSFGPGVDISSIWHGAVSKDKIYRFVFVESSNSSDKVLYSESCDGLNWSKPKSIIQKGTMRHHLYRPCIMATHDNIYCLYGTIDHKNTWRIAMTTWESKRFPEQILVSPNNFNKFRVYIIGATKQVLRSIAILRLAIVALIGSLILGFVPRFRKIWLLWSIIWLVLILMDTSQFARIFSGCIYLLVTGIISLLVVLVSAGVYGFSLRVQS